MPIFRFSRRTVAAFLSTLITGFVPAQACSVCGCSLSADWLAQGYSAMPGLQAQVRYEYFDNTELRRGRGAVDRGTIAFPSDDEIQQDTLNRDVWFGVDYVGHGPWAISAEVPYINRYHRTVTEGDAELSESRASGIGDLRVLGRYQKFSMKQTFGYQFGLKLPTGRIDQTFATGPQADAALDRGLQLGNGTTDLLGGVSWFDRPIPTLGCFAQLLGDLPLYERDGFLPSGNLQFNAGLRYLNPSSFTPQLQVNARWDERERGVNADTPNSGGTLVYVSPGVTAELGQQASTFAFVQLPVYQRVNGLQLEPRWMVSVGITYRR
jgi:hypothetical protein